MADKKSAPTIRNIKFRLPPGGIPTVPPAVAEKLKKPPASGDNPFKNLPYPSPGERIKSDDFKTFSRGLQAIYDIYRLSAALFGKDFGEVKTALVSQGYEIQRVMSVFGNEIKRLDDNALDSRKVIQIMPVELGETNVIVILTEAVETRRTVPNLLGKTYNEAKSLISNVLSDVTLPMTPVTAPNLTGTTLSNARGAL